MVKEHFKKRSKNKKKLIWVVLGNQRKKRTVLSIEKYENQAKKRKDKK
jgi:hypothetical protein